VAFFARHRRFTLAGTVVVAGLSLFSALRVDSGSEFRDFFSADTDLVKSLDAAEIHFGSSSVNETILFIEGDLLRPDVLMAIDEAVDGIDENLPNDAVARRLDGTFDRQLDAAVLARAAVADPVAAGAVTAATGVAIADSDANGYPDTEQQVAAIFDTALVSGLPAGPQGRSISANSVQTVLVANEAGYGTIVEISVPTSEAVEGVNRARDAIELAAEDLGSGPARLAFSRIELAGDAAVNSASLDAFTSAMLLVLPIAVLLCLALASFAMRSVRFAAVAVMPILLVVVMLYGFMTVAGFKVNPVSSTLAAIAVGIGIDFATHFAMRYREELARSAPLDAVREAGAGTGGALLLSGLSSIIGFAIMGFAPMPAFAWFGQLTAVMIFMSVAVALVVLPSLLVLVTPKQRNAIAATTGRTAEVASPA